MTKRKSKGWQPKAGETVYKRRFSWCDPATYHLVVVERVTPTVVTLQTGDRLREHRPGEWSSAFGDIVPVNAKTTAEAEMCRKATEAKACAQEFERLRSNVRAYLNELEATWPNVKMLGDVYGSLVLARSAQTQL